MGFSEPEENWSKLPHEFIGSMGAIASLAEMKVVLYVLRHTWGYHDRQGIRETEKRISLDEFCHGRKLKGGERMDAGTGMSLNAVKDGIKRAIDDGYITIAAKDETDKARVKTWYALAMRVSEVDTHLSKVDTQPSEVDPRSKKDTLERNLEKDGAQPAPAPSDEKEPIDFPTPAPREKTTLEDVKRRIVAAGQSGLERGGKRRGVSDPYLAAGEEQRDWAAQIASVIARQPISVGQLGDMPAAIRKDYVWKAKDVMDDITRGKVPRERYVQAFTHLLNGGGSKYEKYGATSAQVVRDAAQIASGETQEERDAQIKAARMAA